MASAPVALQGRDLVVAYTKVIKRLRTRKLDFDIEGRASLDATVVNTRRFKAIRALEAKFPRLEVSLTIPVARDGIDTGYADGDGIAFLELAKRVRARIDVVNLMTMDYGDTVTDMGQAAITSATRALAQIRKIWPRDTYANLGITPMIGENDSPGETFTLADARTVVGFAEAHGVRRLAFWAVNRDQSCGAGDHAPDTCTGLAPSRLDYTDAFLA